MSGVVGSIVSFNDADRGAARPRRHRPTAPVHARRLPRRRRGRHARRRPRPRRRQPPRCTASGSIAAAPIAARVARASRILVEGIHDAELVEKVWGDDLRDVGVVVERLDGMDDLADVVRALDPGPGRRLGVLLDHLVDGSKETRAADAGPPPARARHRHAVRRRVGGGPARRSPASHAWPDVPRGVPWKEGVLDALGVDHQPRRVLAPAPGPGADLRRPRPSPRRCRRAADRLRHRGVTPPSVRAMSDDSASTRSPTRSRTASPSLRLDDGKVNVISHRVIDLLHQYLDNAEGEARAVAIIGRPGKLSAGFDLTEMTAGIERTRALVGAGGKLLMRIFGHPQPWSWSPSPAMPSPLARCSRWRATRASAVTVPPRSGSTRPPSGWASPSTPPSWPRPGSRPATSPEAPIQAEIYDPAGAVEAGYLDRVVAADDCEATAIAEARRLGEFRTGAYSHTKLALRGALIERVIAGIDADMASISAPAPEQPAAPHPRHPARRGTVCPWWSGRSSEPLVGRTRELDIGRAMLALRPRACPRSSSSAVRPASARRAWPEPSQREAAARVRSRSGGRGRRTFRFPTCPLPPRSTRSGTSD